MQQQNDPRILAMAWESVRLYVHHTLALYQNSDTKNRELFTVGCLKVSSFSWQNFVPLHARIPLERERQRGVPP